jgi:hypothetical protein
LDANEKTPAGRERGALSVCLAFIPTGGDPTGVLIVIAVVLCIGV